MNNSTQAGLGKRAGLGWRKSLILTPYVHRGEFMPPRPPLSPRPVFKACIVTLHTEMRFILCTWFGEISSCSCLTALPGPAWVLLNKICKE